jgi:hypothetical protein
LQIGLSDIEGQGTHDITRNFPSSPRRRGSIVP